MSKESKADKIRGFIIFIMIQFVIPVVLILIYWEIAGEEFFMSEFGQLVMIGIYVLGWISSIQVYEYLFPKYKNDVN